MKKVTTPEGVKFVSTENAKEIRTIEGKNKKFYIAISYKDATENLLIGSFDTKEDALNVIINDLL